MVRQNKIGINDQMNMISSIPLRSAPLVEISDNRRILIENHLGVTAFGQNQICIRVPKGNIEILGDHLQILSMTKERVVICGVIHTVRLLEE